LERIPIKPVLKNLFTGFLFSWFVQKSLAGGVKTSGYRLSTQQSMGNMLLM